MKKFSDVLRDAKLQPNAWFLRFMSTFVVMFFNFVTKISKISNLFQVEFPRQSKYPRRPSNQMGWSAFFIRRIAAVQIRESTCVFSRFALCNSLLRHIFTQTCQYLEASRNIRHRLLNRNRYANSSVDDHYKRMRNAHASTALPPRPYFSNRNPCKCGIFRINIVLFPRRRGHFYVSTVHRSAICILFISWNLHFRKHRRRWRRRYKAVSVHNFRIDIVHCEFYAVQCVFTTVIPFLPRVTSIAGY